MLKKTNTVSVSKLITYVVFISITFFMGIIPSVASFLRSKYFILNLLWKLVGILSSHFLCQIDNDNQIDNIFTQCFKNYFYNVYLYHYICPTSKFLVKNKFNKVQMSNENKILLFILMLYLSLIVCLVSLLVNSFSTKFSQKRMIWKFTKA